MDDDFDFEAKAKAKIQEVKDEKPQTASTAPAVKKKKDAGFGGFAAGFLNAKPKKQAVKKAAPEPEKKQQAQVEDLTHMKAKGKDDRLKLDEVQDAMNQSKNFLETSKDKWLTP